MNLKAKRIFNTSDVWLPEIKGVNDKELEELIFEQLHHDWTYAANFNDLSTYENIEELVTCSLLDSIIVEEDENENLTPSCQAYIDNLVNLIMRQIIERAITLRENQLKDLKELQQCK